MEYYKPPTIQLVLNGCKSKCFTTDTFTDNLSHNLHYLKPLTANSKMVFADGILQKQQTIQLLEQLDFGTGNVQLVQKLKLNILV